MKMQRQKQPGRCVFTEPELLSQTSKHVVQKKIIATKIPIIVTTIVMKYNSINKSTKGTHSDTQH